MSSQCRSAYPSVQLIFICSGAYVMLATCIMAMATLQVNAVCLDIFQACITGALSLSFFMLAGSKSNDYHGSYIRVGMLVCLYSTRSNTPEVYNSGNIRALVFASLRL